MENIEEHLAEINESIVEVRFAIADLNDNLKSIALLLEGILAAMPKK